MIFDKNVSKLSIIGVGMITTPGVTFRMFQALAKKNIQSRTYYPIPLHRVKPDKTQQSFPNSEFASVNGLAIPVHQYLTDKEVKLIIKTIKEVL